jgi:hypothetical protein
MYEFAYCFIGNDRVRWSAETARSLRQRLENAVEPLERDELSRVLEFIETSSPGEFITASDGTLIFRCSGERAPIEEPVAPPAKPSKKKEKFQLPPAFSDRQEEADKLLDSLQCEYEIKKGKWNRDILQWILKVPADSKHLEPGARAGIYLHPSHWSIGSIKVEDPYDDPDLEHFPEDIYEYADCNGIELT